jgi:tetratricopeptide (TPR) repeat protein
LSAARNTGIRKARGKYIAYLDDDDTYYPNHLNTLINYLENSEFKIAYTDAYRAHQVKQNGKYVTTHKDLPLSLDFDYNKILYENFVPVLCFMHEKQCLDKAGDFDETLSRHEDWDLWIRLSRHFKMAHLKKVTCEFSSRKDGSSMTSGKKAGFRTTCERIYQKYAEYTEGKPFILKAQSRMRSILRGAEAFQLMKEGNVHQAIRLMEDCLSFDPDFPETHKILGTLYSSLKKNSTALSYYEKAARLCVSDAEYQKNQEVMREHIGSELSSNPSFDKQKEKIAALMQKGENLVRLGRLKEASDTFQAVFEFDPFHLDGINSLGEIAMKAGLAESALFFFQRALEINSSNARSLYNMSVCLRSMGRNDAAKELLKRIADQDQKGSDQYSCAVSNF